jgi:hypothetical protein
VRLTSVAFLAASGNKLFAVAAEARAGLGSIIISGRPRRSFPTGAALYVSTDGGQSWAPVGRGLTTPYVQSLATQGATVFAGTGGGGIFARQF